MSLLLSLETAMMMSPFRFLGENVTLCRVGGGCFDVPGLETAHAIPFTYKR